MPDSNCVIHRDLSAVEHAQGIPCCRECWDKYNIERRDSNGNFRQRIFLHRLIKASADRLDEVVV